MKEWSDEELDKLFRKSAEEFEPTYEPNDWKELRHRLDDNDQMPVGGWFDQTRPWTIALLLLMILGGISVYKSSSRVGEKRDTTLSVSDKRPPGSSAQPSKVGVQMREGFTKPEDTETVAPDERASDGTPIQETTIPHEPIAGGRSKEIKELPRNPVSVSGVRKQTDLSDRGRGDGAILLSNNKRRRQGAVPAKELLNQKPDFVVNKPERGENEAREREGTNTTQPVGESTSDLPGAAWRDEEIAVEALMPRVGLQVTEGPALPLVNTAAMPDTDFVREQSIPKVPRWAIRIGISPDLSAVNMKMKNFSRPGPAASFLVEYSFARRWALQAGVNRSLKTYSAQAGDYQWPANWYQKQRPVSVDGTCQVFELPLNIRYDLIQQQRARWFASAGMSSYKMQKEKYVYHYKTYDPNIRWWKWEGKTGWYFFSHANASLGYEHRLTERLSLMAEPYVRVPLRRVGFGKVNLFSTGIWFSARYTPVFRK